MKIVSISLIILSSFLSFAQVSYEFGESVPPNGSIVQSIGSNYTGNYLSANSKITYIIEPNRIATTSALMNRISRATLRETANIQVRNGYIFGVENNDSVPCVLDGEYYYFGVRSGQEIYGSGSGSELFELGNGKFILNKVENGRYIPSLIEFKGKEMRISDFDYDWGTTIFDGIQKTLEISKPIFTKVLFPTEEEWKRLNIVDLFGEPTIYKLIK